MADKLAPQDKPTKSNNSASGNKLKAGKVDDVISKGKTMTGSKPDEININPIQEEAEKHAVIAFGRFNPPTTGHEKLIHKVESTAKEKGGEAHIIASHSEGTSKNPVPKEAKVGYIKKVAAKGTHVSSSSSDSHSLLHQATKLHKQGVKHLTMVAGSDRVDEYKHLLNKYNDVPSKHGHYNFKSINVVSAGHRDPDAEGTTGMSGTKMRSLAHSGDTEGFKKGLPKALHQHANEIVNHIKSVKEDIDSDFYNLIAEINVQQRLKRGMIMRRYESKIEGARKRALMRRAGSKVIVSRARKLAIKKMKMRFSGGRDPETLSNMEKQRIEAIVNKRKTAIRRLTMRLIPQVRKKDASRFHKEDLDLSNLNESQDFLYALYEVALEEIDRNDTSKRERGTDSLTKIYKDDTPGKKDTAIDAINNKNNPGYFKKRNAKEKAKDNAEKQEKQSVSEEGAVNSAGGGAVRGMGYVSGIGDGESPNYQGANIADADTKDNLLKKVVAIHQAMHGVKESVDDVFEEKFGKWREAVPRSGQDRHDIDLVVRKGEDRKTDDRPYRQQSINKKVTEAKAPKWDEKEFKLVRPGMWRHHTGDSSIHYGGDNKSYTVMHGNDRDPVKYKTLGGAQKAVRAKYVKEAKQDREYDYEGENQIDEKYGKGYVSAASKIEKAMKAKGVEPNSSDKYRQEMEKNSAAYQAILDKEASAKKKTNEDFENIFELTTTSDIPVWEKPRPKGKSHKLSTSEKAMAKARARAAGRPYPNLIDNMAVAKEETGCSIEEWNEELGLTEDNFTPVGNELYEDWNEIEEEAEHQGHKVKLGKPFLTPGGPKKRSVYVKNVSGNVVKVNFGDPHLSIKRDQPTRKASYRARHHCETPGPRWKANYWSCKYWSSTPTTQLDKG